MNFGARVRFCRYQPAAVLRVSGEDALTFLQGQFTQELRTLTEGGAAYGLWLNQKGKVLADSFVFRGADGVWWIVSYFSAAVVIRERLEAYIIADDVVIEEETAAWEGAVVAGEGAEAWLAGVPGLSWQGRRAGETTWEWLRPKGSELPAGGAEEMTADELERWRIEARIPAVPRDVGPEDLPNEAGLNEVAISYTKGCYLGQEVMARLKTMGRVRRRLLRVRGATGAAMPDLDAGPVELFFGDKRVGQLRSAVKTGEGWAGLAMVTLMSVSPGAGMSFAANGPVGAVLEDFSHD